MNRKYLLSSGPKTARMARLFAKVIDIVVVMIMSFVSYPWGLLLGIIYLSWADSLFDGQSLGKRLVGFSVISLIDGKPCRPRQSLIRNLPFIIPMGFALIPFWGWFIGGFLLFPLMVLELFLLFKLESTHRLGDVLADTTVIAEGQDRADVRKKKQSWFEKQTSICL